CALRKISLLQCIDIRFVVVIVGNFFWAVNAFIVHATLQRDRRRLRLRRAVMMVPEDIANGIAIRDYISLKMPGSTKRVLQEKFVGASRLAIDRIVGTHDRSCVTLYDRSAKCGRIGV